MKIKISAVLAALLAATAAHAQTDQTLEVVSGPTGQRAVTVAAYDPLGQSFTAFTDNITSIGFQFEQMNAVANTPLTLSILAGQTLTGTAIFSQTITLPTLTGAASWVDFDLGDLALTVGQQYTAVLSASTYYAGVVLGPEVNIYTGQVLGGDAYTGGTALFSPEDLFHTYPYGTFCNEQGPCDLNFRITGYNNVAAGVPEPAAWGMMIGGFALAGGAMRRRRSTTVTYAA